MPAAVVSNNLSKNQHLEAINDSRKLNRKDAKLTRQTHVLSLICDVEMALVQLDADLASSMREAERDQFQQRNQQLQTLIVAASVMIAALITLIVQVGPILILSFLYYQLIE